MVVGGRFRPVRPRPVQRDQEGRGIIGVGLGIEGLLQSGEGVRVVVQVDLKAADVDRRDAVRPEGTDIGYPEEQVADAPIRSLAAEIAASQSGSSSATAWPQDNRPEKVSKR